MEAVQAEDRLAAAEAGTAGSSAAEQKASIKNALNTSTDPEDIITSVRCCHSSLCLVCMIAVSVSKVLAQLAHLVSVHDLHH